MQQNIEPEFEAELDGDGDMDSGCLLEYLDGAIDKWRKRRDTDCAPDDYDGDRLRNLAPYYIDAFQSVRASVFGEVKP